MKNHENHPDYPEEYKNGSVEFFGRNFTVTPDVLIPRLETEALIRRARKILQKKLHQKHHLPDNKDFLKETDNNTENSNFLRIFDIGSGSGIIGTSLADLVDEINFIDISPNTLNIAQKNFCKNFPNKKANFIESNLLEKVIFDKNEKYFFVSNLPYIKNDDWKNMSADTIFEPKLALFGGEKTGFELYEKLFSEIDEKEIHGIILIEFGFDQLEVAKNFFKKFPHWHAEFFPDFAGIMRFAEIHF